MPDDTHDPYGGLNDEFDRLLRRAFDEDARRGSIPDPLAYARRVVAVADAREREFFIPTADASSAFVRAVVEAAVGRAIHALRADQTAVTVGRLADLAVRHLLGDGGTPLVARREAYRRAADVIRRTIRRHAERALDTAAGTEVGESGDAIYEPVHPLSNVEFAGSPVEAIRTIDWWQSFAPRHPEMAELYALHRFAGRTVEQLADLTEEDRTALARRLGSARESLDEYLDAMSQPRAAAHATGGAV